MLTFHRWSACRTLWPLSSVWLRTSWGSRAVGYLWYICDAYRDSPGCVGPLVPVHLSRPSFVACLHSPDSEAEQRTLWMWPSRIGVYMCTLSPIVHHVQTAVLTRWNPVGLKTLFRLCTRKFPLVMVLRSFWGKELLKITVGRALTAASQRDMFA